jgi:hypothetical protein
MIIKFKNNAFVVLMSLTFTIAFVGCMKDQSPQAENPNKRSTEEPASKAPNDNMSGIVATTLTKEELAKYDMKPADKLSYMFNYLDVKKGEKIEIIDGKATIKIDKLPIGKSGTLSLEIFKGDVRTLAGSKEGVTLQKGANTVELVLKPVNITPSSDSADLTIDIVLDQGTTNLVDWDGKSFKGNEDFDIVVLTK